MSTPYERQLLQPVIFTDDETLIGWGQIVYVDCSIQNKDITITLPWTRSSTPIGQEVYQTFGYIHVIKTDNTAYKVFVEPFHDTINDTINGSTSVIELSNRWDYVQVYNNNSTNEVVMNTNLAHLIKYSNTKSIKTTLDEIITRLNNGGGVGTGQIYYLNATDTTINSATYKTLTAIPPNGTLTTKNITVNNNTLLIEQFITVPLNKFSLSSGLWNFNIKAKADKIPTGDVIKIYAELWKYSADNTSTLLFTANPNGNNLTLDYAELNLETTATAYSVLNTDRMLVKLYATTTHTQNIIVSIQYNSTTAISHVHTPFVEEISDYLLTNANQDIILGLQETGANGVTVQIKGQQMTGADNQAPNIDITAPNSTGNKPSGIINFKTSIGGASGSTANTPLVMAKVTPQGIESKMFVTQKREITATSSTTTLTANDNGLIEILANSTNFQSIKLPNATLLTEGTTYTILNNSNGNTNIFNDASTVIYTLNASLYINIVLLDNSTANGTWEFIYPKQSDYLLTNANQDIILGTKETDSTGVDVIIKGTAKTGNDAIGNNINIYAPNGTGGGGSGDINFYSASGEASGVVLGAVSSTGASTNTNSLTISHTVPTGSNRYLVVQLSCGASAQANSVTYNGVAMTLINRTSSTSQKVESWGLVAPAQTTANIVITLSNTTSVVAKAINFTNVNQTTPTAKVLTAFNNNQVTSASILYNAVGTPTAVGDFVVSLLGTINQVATEGANQTNIWSGSSGAQERARASYEIASGSATVIDYTFGNSSFAMHSFVVNTITGSSPNTFKKALSVIKDGVNTIGITIEPLEIVASASVTSLDFNSNSKIRITGTTTHTIKLPNSLKLLEGKEYRVINKSTGTVGITDNTGTSIFTVASNSEIYFQLVDNTTIAGTWEQLNTASAGGSTAITNTYNITGHGFTSADIGKAVYYNGTNLVLARSDIASTLATELISSIPSVNSIVTTQIGVLTLANWTNVIGTTTLTAGEYYFVSNATAGQLTATEPSSGFSNPILKAISTTTGIILQYRPSSVDYTTGVKGYLIASLTVAQGANIATGQLIRLDNQRLLLGNTVSFDTSTWTATLTANRNYKITAMVPFCDPAALNNPHLQYSIKITGTTPVSNSGGTYASSTADSTAGSMLAYAVVINANANTTVQLEQTKWVSNPCERIGAVGTGVYTTLSQSYPVLIIEEI
jgi:hypothetical protein